MIQLHYDSDNRNALYLSIKLFHDLDTYHNYVSFVQLYQKVYCFIQLFLHTVHFMYLRHLAQHCFMVQI